MCLPPRELSCCSKSLTNTSLTPNATNSQHKMVSSKKPAAALSKTLARPTKSTTTMLELFTSDIATAATKLWNKFTKRLYIYLAINVFVVAIAVLSFVMVSRGTQTSLFAEAGSIYVSSVIRMLGTVLYFEAIARFGGIQRIDQRDSKNLDNDHSFWSSIKGVFLIAGVCEVVNMMYSTRYAGFGFVPHTESFLLEYATFIPKSFVLELTLDFFHYWAHRYFHRNKFLFRLVHAEHHVHVHLTPIDCYAQTYLEVIFTNMIPLFMAFRFGPRMSLWQLHLSMSYKTFIEVAGHAGLDFRGPSFPQFPFLGWFTDGIILRTQDHDWHHTKPTANFSKRFSLWDRLFGTYEEPKTTRRKRNSAQESLEACHTK